MTNLTTNGTIFLGICEPRLRDRCAAAIETLEAAVDGADLYAVDYRTAKESLDRAVEGAWNLTVRAPYLVGRGFETPEAAFVDRLGEVSALRDVPARAKRLAGAIRAVPAVDRGMLDAVVSLLAAAAPIAALVKNLKASAIKGRRPVERPADPAAAEREAAKRTCPCCFRRVSLTGSGTVVRHGWEEQGGRRVGQFGNAWHTGACFGVGYRPWEESSRGTRDYVARLGELEQERVQARDRLAARPAEIRVPRVRIERGVRRVEYVALTRDDVDLRFVAGRPDVTFYRSAYDRLEALGGDPCAYTYELARLVAGVRAEIEDLRRAIADLRSRISGRSDGR